MQVLVNILNATGPIQVPEFGEFSTQITPECDCPQVIYELESFADVEGPVVWSENEPGKIVFAPKNYDNRKKIVGPLMNSILSNAMGQSKDKIPALFNAIWDSVQEKYVLVYLFDEKAQSLADLWKLYSVEYADIKAVIDKYSGYEFTYKEFYEKIKFLSCGLKSLWLKKGEHVSLFSENSAKCLLADQAVVN